MGNVKKVVFTTDFKDFKNEVHNAVVEQEKLNFKTYKENPEKVNKVNK